MRKVATIICSIPPIRAVGRCLRHGWSRLSTCSEDSPSPPGGVLTCCSHCFNVQKTPMADKRCSSVRHRVRRRVTGRSFARPQGQQAAQAQILILGPPTRRWLSAIAIEICALVVILSGCTRDSPQLPVAEYRMNIVGRWIGTVGQERESMTINGDGTFVCHLQNEGFIAEMLYPALPGTVSGTWSIAGSVMTLTVTDAKNARLDNRVSTGVLVSFRKDEIELKSHGHTSSFRRTAGPEG